MLSILEEICELTHPTMIAPECQQIVKKQAPYYEAIQKHLGLDFVNEFCALIGEALAVSERLEFVRGFRMGYQLFSAATDSRYSS